MKLPRRIEDILAKKQVFIDRQRDKLEASVIKAQSQLFSDVISEMQLDTKDGIIRETANNYRQLAALDNAYKSFSKIANQSFLNQIAITTMKIGDMNSVYFQMFDMPARFEKIIAKTDKLMNLRIGLDRGKLVRGGFLESFFSSNTLGTELKQFTSKSVTSNVTMRDYVKGLKQLIVGSEEYKGGLERQFARYGYDLYQQYDAAYNMTLGNEFGFSYFIYQGGLVDDSRDFCREHNNHVYSVEEAQSWATWTPADAIFITDFKQKDLNAVPSYLGYPGYDPLIDRGGYNCRHALGWIDDEMAFKMRPDLKE